MHRPIILQYVLLLVGSKLFNLRKVSLPAGALINSLFLNLPPVKILGELFRFGKAHKVCSTS